MSTTGNADGTGTTAPAASIQPTFTQDQVNKMVNDARAEGGNVAARRVRATLSEQFKDDPDRLELLQRTLQADEKAAQAQSVIEELEALRKEKAEFAAEREASKRKDKAAEIARAEGIDPAVLLPYAAKLTEGELTTLAKTLPKAGNSQQSQTARPDSNVTSGHGGRTFKESELNDRAFWEANKAAIIEAKQAGRIKLGE